MEIMGMLVSGLFGAFLIFLLHLWVNGAERAIRIRGNWAALHVEVRECGRIASGYIKDNVAAPLYRLPTICYGNCLPSLLSDAGINEDDADALLKYYAEVQTLNRGLDLADRARHTKVDQEVAAEVKRNYLKAQRIGQPSGDLYAKAVAACEIGKAPPGVATRVFGEFSK